MDRKSIIKYIYEAEYELRNEFKKHENICFYNSMKVLDAFHKNEISESHLSGTTGYGYNDLGRDKIEKVFAEIFDGEKECCEIGISLIST